MSRKKFAVKVGQKFVCNIAGELARVNKTTNQSLFRRKVAVYCKRCARRSILVKTTVTSNASITWFESSSIVIPLLQRPLINETFRIHRYSVFISILHFAVASCVTALTHCVWCSRATLSRPISVNLTFFFWNWRTNISKKTDKLWGRKRDKAFIIVGRGPLKKIQIKSNDSRERKKIIHKEHTIHNEE